MIGIRLEDKNIWERRTPLTPQDASELQREHGLTFYVQPSPNRVFGDQEYSLAGVRLSEDLSECSIIFAVKEMPGWFFQPGKTYVFFSHTTKGQPYNMPMLKRMMELGCQLIDYEKIVDERGRRLIFFGRHAGIAGMIDTLWALGKRLTWEGIRNPFSEILQAHRYESLVQAKESVSATGALIRKEGLEGSLAPMAFGFAGYGNVYEGTREIFELLPFRELAPEEIDSVFRNRLPPSHHLYRIAFKEIHTVERISQEGCFDLQDYYDHPEGYRSRFHSYVPYLSVVMNCIYWEKRYPRLITRDYLKDLFQAQEAPRLRVIGDISCDVEGAIECNTRCTDSGNPVYVYDPLTGETQDGWEGRGVVVLAVDNLPCEIPRESSIYFSSILKRFIPVIAQADYSVDFEHCQLPREIKDACILYHGKLTPKYRYLEKFL